MDKISGLKEIKKQINTVSKSTRDFINSLVDELSFVETDMFYKNEKDDIKTGEGVICGYARISDSPVFIFAQNFDVLSGGLTSGQAEKIVKCLDSAEKLGYPVISILSTHGTKFDEGLSSLEGFAKVIAKSSGLYGVVPQICIIKGDVLGSMSYYAANCDFVYMLQDSVLCPTSPLVAAASNNKNNDPKALFGANTLISKSGLVSRVCKDQKELNSDIKKLLDLIEQDNLDESEAALNKTSEKLNGGYNTETIKSEVLDKNTFFEISRGFGDELICGLAKICGLTVGVILSKDGEDVVLTSNACKKASKFVRFLDNFDIPLITFVNIVGISSDISAIQTSLIKDVANLMSAISDSDIPKIAVLCDNVYGIGYTALSSKSVGFNYNFAWANSGINVLAPKINCELSADKLREGKNITKVRQEIIANYQETESNPINAAYRGFVDNIIEPKQTRAYLMSVLVMF